MRYVILRDDDTNALTPVTCLEQLYRPFLDRNLPVNLAVIPCVRTEARTPQGEPEGFLLAKNGTSTAPVLPLAENRDLTAYLKANPGFRVVQHGCHHDCCEFELTDRQEIRRRLDSGARWLREAGFAPSAFVAPHDRLSRPSLAEVAVRFQVLSTGWFELGRLPRTWWPRYLFKKLRRAPHWRVGNAWLLSHPGCLLSCHRPYDRMLDSVKAAIQRRQLTVLVTHWWEYFRGGCPDQPFIAILHQVAAYLASQPDLRVITFEDLNRV